MCSSPRWHGIFTQHYPVMPQQWIKWRPPPLPLLVVVLLCGRVDKRRGKGHGLRAGHKVKGRSPPRIPSECMCFPRKPLNLATGAFPTGETNDHVSPSKWQSASKTHRDACEPFSCSPRWEGQSRPKQLWLLVNAIRNQNGIKTNQNGIKKYFHLAKSEVNISLPFAQFVACFQSISTFW